MKRNVFFGVVLAVIAFVGLVGINPGYAQEAAAVPGQGKIVLRDGGSLSTAPDFWYDTDGLGIGTLTPADDLHIFSDDDTVLLVDTTGTDATAVVKFQMGTQGNGVDPVNHSNTKGWDFLAYGYAYTTPSLQNDLRVRYYNGTGATDVIHFETNGNVGIGTTEPAEKLEVDGNILASGTICDGSGCLASMMVLIAAQQAQITELKALVCAEQVEAEACK